MRLDEAREHVLRQYGGDIGRRRGELITPALVLDVDAAQRNIDHMAAALRELGSAAIRPHYKTHKSPELARRQVEAGARGLSAATVWEAAVLAEAGQMVPGFEHPLTVQASVISRQSGQVIVDAGNKSVAAPADVTIEGHPLRPVRFDEEHGIFAAPQGSPLRVGDSVALVPGYSPTTVN